MIYKESGGRSHSSKFVMTHDQERSYWRIDEGRKLEVAPLKDKDELIKHVEEHLLAKLCRCHTEPEECPIIKSGQQVIRDREDHPEHLNHLKNFLTELVLTFGSDKGVLRANQPKIKIHFVANTNTYGAEGQIIRKMKDELNIELIRTKHEDCDVVLLLCVVISRVGSDVDGAMRTIPDAAKVKPVILVMLYHTRNEDYPTDTVQWSTTYPQVKFHVDILFHQTKKGLLESDKNDQAIQKLCSVIKEHTRLDNQPNFSTYF